MSSAIKTFFTPQSLKKHGLIFALLLFTFFGLFTVYNKFIYTFGFTDEGDNISIGKFLLEDKKLYRDVFSQHQPLTYYISAGLQEVTQPDNILLVIRRHRQFIMLFSFLWIAFLTYRFGYRLLPFLSIVELLKYYYLGHLFLAESLVIYPLIYLFCLWWQTAKRNTMTKFDAVLASFSAFFVVFNLLPTVAAVGFLMLALLYLVRKDRLLVLLLVLPALLATIILFLFVPITSYIETTIWANIFYYIPNSNNYAFKVETGRFHTIQNAVLWPLTYLLTTGSVFATVQVLLVLFWVSSLILYLSLTKRYVMVVISYILLVLINSRPPLGSLIYYHIFHSLPFFALFIISIGLLWDEILQSALSLKTRVVYLLPLLLIFFLFMVNKDFYFREQLSERDTPYIQFSPIYLYSDAVRALAKEGDTFAVYPYEELLYWYSGLSSPTRFLFLQSWVYDVPQYRQEIHDALRKNPPTFVYARDTLLEPYLSRRDYVTLPLNDMSYSPLFVRKDRLSQITEAQWEDIKRHGFRKPETLKKTISPQEKKESLDVGVTHTQ